MLKVLYVHGGSLDLAGTEAIMMNYYRHIDKEKITIDFMVHGNNRGYYDDEIESNDNKVYYAPLMRNVFQYITYIFSFFKKYHYDIIHVHMNENAALILLIAKIKGVKVRIVHSHNTNYVKVNVFKKIVRSTEKEIIRISATDYFSCGSLAAEALYGKNFVKKKHIEILNNGITIEKYIFDLKLRKRHRADLNLSDDTMLIGNIGRLSNQKNQSFLIKVMSELVKQNSSYKLVIFGDGELKERTMELIKEHNLEKFIEIKLPVKQVNEWYNAFDIFVLPSLYEGFPVVAVEEQANGGPCLISDTVTKKCKLTDQVIFLPLEVEAWVSTILDTDKSLENRKQASDNNATILSDKGYNSVKVAQRVEECYIEKFK